MPVTICHKAYKGSDAALKALKPGDVIADAALAAAARDAGIADDRAVIATAKFIHVAENGPVAIGERQPINDPSVAVHALALGRARLDPPLGDGVALNIDYPYQRKRAAAVSPKRARAAEEAAAE